MSEAHGSYYAECLCGCGSVVYWVHDLPAHRAGTIKENAKQARKGFTIRYADDTGAIIKRVARCKGKP